MKKRSVRNEEGYTLLETVAAMAIFLGVLIPLITIMGNLLFDKTRDRLEGALRLAQSELAEVTVEKTFTDQLGKVRDSYLIDRKITRTDALVTILIRVRSVREPKREILSLERSLIDYR